MFFDFSRCYKNYEVQFFSKFPSFLLIFKQNRSLLFCHILPKMRPMFCHINQKVPETGWSLKICLVHEVYTSLPWLRMPVLNHRNSSWVCLADIIPQSVVWQKKVKAWNYQSVLCNFHAVIYACHINHLAAHILVRREDPLADDIVKIMQRFLTLILSIKLTNFLAFFLATSCSRARWTVWLPLPTS